MQKAAIEELSTKTLDDIQRETAIKWAHRAWAARLLAANADMENRLRLLGDAGEYAHEAIEHAALADDDDLLALVRRIIQP
jgi:hypothetical protein